MDKVEFALLWVVGLLLGAFVTTTFLDVLTRTIGEPWLSLQELTMIAFSWGIFLGTAVAVRRNEHFYMTRLVLHLTGKLRMVMETFNHLIMLGISVALAYYGIRLTLQGFGNTLPVTKLPLSVMTGAIPVAGVLSGLFTLERLLNGWIRGFEQPGQAAVVPVATT